MKYILYIDYRASYTPRATEYKPMSAKNIKEAILEADEAFNPKTMYLIKIMEKIGKIQKVERDVKAQEFVAILEKRSIKWTNPERNHTTKHFMTKFCDWFEIA